VPRLCAARVVDVARAPDRLRLGPVVGAATHSTEQPGPLVARTFPITPDSWCRATNATASATASSVAATPDTAQPPPAVTVTVIEVASGSGTVR
jgi:hypothetical protein